MSTFNSYTVYDKAGNLIANGRASAGFPEPYFESLSSDVRQRAVAMLVLQESGFVARYRVIQPTVPVLGPRENLGS